MSRIDFSKLTEAAKIAAHSYNPQASTVLAPRIDRQTNKMGAEATLLKDGVLLIPGTNSFADWVNFNLQIVLLSGARLSVRGTTTEAGTSGTIWHQGFLRHARLIQEWIGGDKPDYIIGHSLGGATAQILSMTWNVPAIAFASPRPKKTSSTAPRSSKCLTLCRADDPVCRVISTFQHMGVPKWLVHRRPRFGLNHNMFAYIDVLAHHAGRDHIPVRWTG